MEYKYAGTHTDMKRIDKLNKLTNKETFWSEVGKLTKNITSRIAYNSWMLLAKIRYEELEKENQ